MMKRREFIGLSAGLGASLLLVGVSEASAHVQLTWLDPLVSVDGFRVYWGKTSHVGVLEPDNAVDGSPYTDVVDIQFPDVRTYDAPVGHGQYYFRLAALIGGGVSEFTNEVGVYIPLWAPENMSVLL